MRKQGCLFRNVIRLRLQMQSHDCKRIPNWENDWVKQGERKYCPILIFIRTRRNWANYLAQKFLPSPSRRRLHMSPSGKEKEQHNGNCLLAILDFSWIDFIYVFRFSKPPGVKSDHSSQKSSRRETTSFCQRNCCRAQ